VIGDEFSGFRIQDSEVLEPEGRRPQRPIYPYTGTTTRRYWDAKRFGMVMCLWSRFQIADTVLVHQGRDTGIRGDEGVKKRKQENRMVDTRIGRYVDT
jgi:hypothetical protein